MIKFVYFIFKLILETYFIYNRKYTNYSSCGICFAQCFIQQIGACNLSL